MIPRRRLRESVPGSAPPVGESDTHLPRTHFQQVPRRALACLAVLLVCYAISLCYRYFPASPPAAAQDLSVAKTSRASEQPDLVAARANFTVRQPPSPFRFTEIATPAGIDFVHFSGMTEAKHFPTAYGSGVGDLRFRQRRQARPLFRNRARSCRSDRS